MAERIDLTVPEAKPENTRYGLERVTLNVLARVVVVDLRGQNGESRTIQYDETTTPKGAQVLSTWNTSNNTTTSLMKRIMLRAIADLGLAGSVSGTPE